MAGRASRPGACPASRPGTSRPALTRTQIMREAKNAAIVQKESHPEQPKPCPARSRTGLARLGPPPADPKKIDFARPSMTKAMQMRQKLAAEKIQRAAEADRQRETISHRPKRTPAPVGDDARMTRQRSTVMAGRGRTPVRHERALQEAIDRGHIATERGGHRPTTAALDTAIARGHITSERGGTRSKRATPGTSIRPSATATPIIEETRELARSMNAEVVQAIPMTDGPVDKIIIEPGAIRPDCSTIVCIASPDRADGIGSSDIANRSIQVISESLDEQDAAESAAVQDKLESLQNARREFVIAVANVGNNVVNIHDDSDDMILNIDELGDQLEYIPSPPRGRKVVRIPDIEHEMFQPEYGREHPDVEAARKFSRRAQAEMEQRDAQRRIEEEFERLAQQRVDDFDLDMPLEQIIQEGDISFEEDEYGIAMPCPSRIKASMPIPRRTGHQPMQGGDIEDIERFFDIQRYPILPGYTAVPPGRIGIHPDLHELEDPWYFEETRTGGPPLMHFESPC